MSGSKRCTFANRLDFRFYALMTKSRGVGVKDMSAHSLAPRGQQSPPRSEPEGLSDEQLCAAVAPTPPPPAQLVSCLEWEGAWKKLFLWSYYSMQDK